MSARLFTENAVEPANTREHEIGAVYRFNGELILATYAGFVSLGAPDRTWSRTTFLQSTEYSKPTIERLPRGTKILYTSEA